MTTTQNTFNRFVEHFGNIATFVEPYGSLWKSRGKTINIRPVRDSAGFASWLEQSPIVARAELNGVDVYRVTLV